MSDKRDKKAINTEPTCSFCVNYDHDKDLCLLKGIEKCKNKIEFSKCTDYMIHAKYIMF